MMNCGILISMKRHSWRTGPRFDRKTYDRSLKLAGTIRVLEMSVYGHAGQYLYEKTWNPKRGKGIKQKRHGNKTQRGHMLPPAAWKSKWKQIAINWNIETRCNYSPPIRAKTNYWKSIMGWLPYTSHRELRNTIQRTTSPKKCED